MSETKTQKVILKLVVFAVFANGAFIIFGALANRFVIRHSSSEATVRISIAMIVGMSLIYLSTLLARRKYTAWLVTLGVYVALLGASADETAGLLTHRTDLAYLKLIHSIIMPIIIVYGLVIYRKQFSVRSDIRSFALSMRFIGLSLLIAFLYGVIGMQILDKKDFHQEINLIQSAHYTVDQFGLTTNNLLTGYTARARIFLNSLSLVSTISLVYAAISLFQPIRARFSDQTDNRIDLEHLLMRYGGTSEDYFKLWPHDKTYFLSADKQAAIAYSVHHGVALSVGDIVGDKHISTKLFDQFLELCLTNDWSIAFIHTQDKWSSFYKHHGFEMQKIGQEAVIDLNKLESNILSQKYFREIIKRFTKLDYTPEVLLPPHNPAIINRLKSINDDWLKKPGRSERSFMMGYFSEAYLQQCTLLVVRDAAQTIQAFINQIPSFDKDEASYDMLRSSSGSPGNINDFIMIEYMKYCAKQGNSRLNLGLCPLAGLDEHDEAVTNRFLKLVYSNGDKFYSFNGLYKFKAKYEPVWRDRYIAYKGGTRGFIKSMRALNKAMSVSKRPWHVF